MPLKIPDKNIAAEPESTTSTKNVPTDNKQFHLEETQKNAKGNSVLESSLLDDSSHGKTFVNYNGTRECSKVTPNATNVDCSTLSKFQGQEQTENGIKNLGSDKSKSVATERKVVLEDESKSNSRHHPNSQRSHKGVRHSPNLVIVATTPVTTFHSDGKISTTDFTPDKDASVQKLSTSEGSIRFTGEYHNTFI